MMSRNVQHVQPFASLTLAVQVDVGGVTFAQVLQELVDKGLKLSVDAKLSKAVEDLLLSSVPDLPASLPSSAKATW